jgi:hypothetical protein
LIVQNFQRQNEITSSISNSFYKVNQELDGGFEVGKQDALYMVNEVDSQDSDLQNQIFGQEKEVQFLLPTRRKKGRLAFKSFFKKNDWFADNPSATGDQKIRYVPDGTMAKSSHQDT